MFTFIKTFGLKLFLRKEIFPLGMSWLIAELFYKFGSFSLECGAFILTWFGLSWITSALTNNK
jgi:hypothetical protein